MRKKNKKNICIVWAKNQSWCGQYIVSPQTSLIVWRLNVDFFLWCCGVIWRKSLCSCQFQIFTLICLYFCFTIYSNSIVLTLCCRTAARNYCLGAIHHTSEECWFYAWTNDIISIKRCTCTAKPQGLLQVSVQLRSVHFQWWEYWKCSHG